MKRSFRKSGEHRFFWRHPDVPILTVCRTIMLAGHETTSKTVGTFSSAVIFSDAILTNSSADLRILGVG